MLKPKHKLWLYWIVTVVFVGSAGLGGLVELCTSGPANIVAIMIHLGYPLYLMKILGLAKALGTVAILSGFSPRLKEWAYAGFFIDFIGAAASHALVGDRTPVFVPAPHDGAVRGFVRPLA